MRALSHVHTLTQGTTPASSTILGLLFKGKLQVSFNIFLMLLLPEVLNFLFYHVESSITVVCTQINKCHVVLELGYTAGAGSTV